MLVWERKARRPTLPRCARQNKLREADTDVMGATLRRDVQWHIRLLSRHIDDGAMASKVICDSWGATYSSSSSSSLGRETSSSSSSCFLLRPVIAQYGFRLVLIGKDMIV